jgi:hypothetical protein
MRDECVLARRCAAAVILAVACSGCTPSTNAPRGWLPVAVDSPLDAYGGWIKLTYEDRGRQTLKGEFLAVDADSVYVLAAAAVVTVPVAEVRKATVAGYDPRGGNVSAQSVFGALTSFSHGVFAIISIPLLWVGGGNAATHMHAREAIVRLHGRNWSPLHRFARFPQGPPPDLRALGLRPRPYAGSLPPPPPPPAASPDPF